MRLSRKRPNEAEQDNLTVVMALPMGQMEHGVRTRRGRNRPNHLRIGSRSLSSRMAHQRSDAPRLTAFEMEVCAVNRFLFEAGNDQGDIVSVVLETWDELYDSPLSKLIPR